MGSVHLPDVADIERQLAAFWRQASADGQAVVRACTLNVIVACNTLEEAAAATPAIARLSEHHPGRALVIATVDEPASQPGGPLEAWVSTHCHRGPGGRQVCSEQVTLAARGEGIELVPETLLQLFEPDCPVYTWWRRTALAADPLWEPLARLSDRCILDSATEPDPVATLRDLAHLAGRRDWKGSAGDLAWVRLESWREVIASQFDSNLTRGYLAGISSVEITAGGPARRDGASAAGAYLAGWLASRLDWRFAGGVWSRPDGGEVRLCLHHDACLDDSVIGGVRILAADDGREAAFVIERTSPGTDVVRIRMETAGTCPLPYTARIEHHDDFSLLCGEIERSAHDRVFEQALDAAATLASAAGSAS